MSSSKKPGDWDCPSCDYLNFSRRDSCQRCGEQRPIAAGDYGTTPRYPSSYGPTGGATRGNYTDDVRPGDWYCSECNAHNFASRTGCFKCGSYRDEVVPMDGRRYEGRRDRSTPAAGTGAGAAPANYTSGYNPAGSRSGWKSGDWICSRTGCKEHNFASRLECFRCSAPRDSDWCLVKSYGSEL